MPDGKFAEIKTCYRVDQLGKCNRCGEPVASIESRRASCGSEDVSRITVDRLRFARRKVRIPMPSHTSKSDLLRRLEEIRQRQSWSIPQTADFIAEALYGQAIEKFREWLPKPLSR